MWNHPGSSYHKQSAKAAVYMCTNFSDVFKCQSLFIVKGCSRFCSVVLYIYKWNHFVWINLNVREFWVFLLVSKQAPWLIIPLHSIYILVLRMAWYFFDITSPLIILHIHFLTGSARCCNISECVNISKTWHQCSNMMMYAKQMKKTYKVSQNN